MKLKRTIERWAKCVPAVICAGSPAQVLYCVVDAQHDIAALSAEIERLRAQQPAVRALAMAFLDAWECRKGGTFPWNAAARAGLVDEWNLTPLGVEAQRLAENGT